MPTPFDAVLADAIQSLRSLTRLRSDVPRSRERIDRFRAAHPGLRANLLVDQPPGSPEVDYDLLLEHPDGGTVSLCWRADDGIPWRVEYADHWAANYVLSVGEQHITVQDALHVLHDLGQTTPDLLDALVDQALLDQAVAEDPPDVSEADVQRAADDFRRVRGLITAAASRRWLTELGITPEQFTEWMRRVAQRQALVARVTNDDVIPFFEAEGCAFDELFVYEVELPTADAADRLADDAVADGRGLLAASSRLAGTAGAAQTSGRFGSRRARDVAPLLRSATVGAIVRYEHDGRSCVGQVLNRTPAVLDPALRADIQRELFGRWLSERRAQAAVRWHWM